MVVLLAVLAVFVLLVFNEWWWRKTKKHHELNRKFIHLTVGTFVAFWPFFLSWNEIRFLSLVFLLAVALSKYFKIFKAIHSVARPTFGEIFFAIAVGAVTFVTQSKGVYAIALLQMSLADGIAALAGVRYGKPYEYKIFGHTKSLVGTGTFILVSYSLLLSYSFYSMAFGILMSLALAFGAAFIENLAIRGLDNLLVPLLVALTMRLVT